MGEIVAVLSFIFALLVWYFLVEYKLSKLKTRIHMLDDIYTRKENIAAAVEVLEGLIRNLNAICRDHQKRLDILESDHPDSEIDYGEVDDDANVIAVWFDGKKYVPEDKKDEDAIKIYADNKVMTETTRPKENRCCATCRHYRPGPDHTCIIRPWLCTSPARAAESSSICNNYKKTESDCYSATKGEVDYPYIHVPYGNGETDRIMKRVAELQCEIQRLNMIAQFGCTTQELRQRWKELLRNDT